jgi:DNA invertase Pin-like site-specific DNA recombinase
MKKKQRQRKKGGGRKFADGNFSKAQFIHRARKWFLYNTSIKGFLLKYGISRQTYYRFLNTHQWFNKEITDGRHDLIRLKKRNLLQMLQWLKDNPDKAPFDYYFRDIGKFDFDVEIQNHELKIVHRD